MNLSNHLVKPSVLSEKYPSLLSSKYLQASRRKKFGKKKRKKKTQKVFHGHYETVSKKPLLSPIPEMTEDTSLISSYESTPESSVSILGKYVPIGCFLVCVINAKLSIACWPDQ